MRTLNKKQKKLIAEWIEASLLDDLNIYTIDQMDERQANSILSFNDHETFWQNADRFINDYLLDKKYRRKA